MVSERGYESELAGSKPAAVDRQNNSQSEEASTAERDRSAGFSAELSAASAGSVASSAAGAPELAGSEARETGSSVSGDSSSEPPEARVPNPEVPARPLSPASPERSVWPARVTAAIASSLEWVTRPRVRLGLTGAILLLIGALLTTNSVLTLPLVIVGAGMIVIAWIGHRLEGRFAIEWGQAGTQLAFRATVKAARPAEEAPLRGSSDSTKLARTHELDLEAAQIIDGEAHTVEIDLAELKALIAAVETTEAEAAPYAAAQDIRIRRVARDGANALR